MSVETVDNINNNIKKATSFVKKRVNYEAKKGLFGFSIEISQIPPSYFWNRDNIGKFIRRMKKLGLDTPNFNLSKNVINITWYSSDEVDRLMNSNKESKINSRFISNGKILNGLIRKHMIRNGEDDNNEEIYNYNIQYRDNGFDDKKSKGKFKSKRIYFNDGENEQENDEEYGQDVNNKIIKKNNHKNNNTTHNNNKSSNKNMINRNDHKNGTNYQSPLYKKHNNDNCTVINKNITPNNNKNSKKPQSEDDNSNKPLPILKKQEDEQKKSQREIPKKDNIPNKESSNPKTDHSDSHPPKKEITIDNKNNDISTSQFDDSQPKVEDNPKPKEDTKPKQEISKVEDNPKPKENTKPKEIPKEDNKQIHTEAPTKTKETPKEEITMSIEEKKKLLFQKNEDNKKDSKTPEQLNEERRKKKEETEKKWREQQEQKEKEKQEQETLKREQQKKEQEEARQRKLEKERVFKEQREKEEKEKEEKRNKEIEERNKELEIKEKKRKELEEENKKIELEYRQKILLEHQEREKKEKEERKKKIEETERKWKEMKDEVDNSRTPELERTDIGKVEIPASLTNNDEKRNEGDSKVIPSKEFKTPLKVEDKKDELAKTTHDTKNDDTPLKTNATETKKKDTYIPRGSLDTVHSTLVLPEPIKYNPIHNIEDEELNLTSRSSGRTLNTQNITNIQEVFNTSAKEIEQPLTTEQTVNLVLPSQAKQLRENDKIDSGSETELSKKNLKKQFLKMSSESNPNPKPNGDSLSLPSNNSGSRIKSWDGNKIREEKEKQKTETQIKRNSGNSHRIPVQVEPIKPIRKKGNMKRRSGSFDLSTINENEEHEAKQKEYNSDTQDIHSVNELLMNKKDISDPREIAKVLKDRRVYRNSLKVINNDHLKINTDFPIRETSSSELNSPKKIIQEKENRRRRVLSSRMYPSIKKKDASPRDGHDGDSLMSPRESDSPRDSFVSPRRSNDKI